MATTSDQQFCLHWKNHQTNFISVFSSLLGSESLVDVTLAAEGKHIQAHKIVLSACSTYFQSLFSVNPCKHPIVILKDISYSELKIIVDFMYCGEVIVSQEQLASVLEVAETLRVKGLAEMPERNNHLDASGDKNNDTRITSPSMSGKKNFLKSSVVSGSMELTSKVQFDEDMGESADPVSDPLQIEGESSTTNAQNMKFDPQYGWHESGEGDSDVTIQQSSSEEKNICVKKSTKIEDTIRSNVFSIRHRYNYGRKRGSSLKDRSRKLERPRLQDDGIVITPCLNIPSTPLETEKTSCQPAGLQDSQNPYNCDSGQLTRISTPQKRTHPQKSQNFQNALEAVRDQGLGFCKAARIFGVNNRTLWLEYKRLGYPILKKSLKFIKKE